MMSGPGAPRPGQGHGRAALLAKRVLDIGISASAIVTLSPVMLAIGAAVKLASPHGPIVFRQRRCGIDGRPFVVYKFRTMAPGAEERRKELEALNEADGPPFKIKDDPRIIPRVGVFLRRTGLDELPQLFNVLKGEMSLVGPRPPIPSEVERYEVPQLRRLSVRPGITCLWQTTPDRNDLDFATWVRLDLEYIDNWSLWLDLRIMARTLGVMLRGKGR